MARINREIYEVFHLDYLKIQALESTAAKPEQLPELDSKLLDSIKALSMKSSTASGKQNPIKSSSNDTCVGRCKAANLLLENGYYRKVADIQGVDLNEVIKLTTSLYGKWYLSQNTYIQPVENCIERDTRPRDVISKNGDFYLIMPLGFINMQQKAWV